MNIKKETPSRLLNINNCIRKTKNETDCIVPCLKKISYNDSYVPINIIDHNSIVFPKENNMIIIPKNSFVYRTDYNHFKLSNTSFFYGSFDSAIHYLFKKKLYSNKSLFMFMTTKNLNLLILNEFKYIPIMDEIESVMLFHLLNVCLPSKYVTFTIYKNSINFIIDNMKDLEKIISNYIMKSYIDNTIHFMYEILDRIYTYVNSIDIEEGNKLVFQNISTFLLDKLLQNLLYQFTINNNGYIYINEEYDDISYQKTILYKILDQNVCIPFEFCIFNNNENLILIEKFYYKNHKMMSQSLI